MSSTVIIQDAENLIRSSYLNRSFLVIAVECGVMDQIVECLPFAQSDIDLLACVKEAIAVNHPALANALDVESLRAIVAHFEDLLTVSPVVTTDDLPDLLDMDGPDNVTAVRNGTTSTTIDISFDKQPVGYAYEIYLDKIFQKTGIDVGLDETTDETLEDIPDDSVDREVRVLYREIATGALTRFGTPVTVS